MSKRRAPRRFKRGRGPASQVERAGIETAAPDCAEPTPTSGPFADLGLAAPLLASLARAGFTEPSDIQRALIPPALAGRDCLGQARTGTGKTASFTLPLLQRVKPGLGIQALVVTPTRELAAQVAEHVQMLSPKNAPRTLVVYGGTSIVGNLRELKKKVDILVGTPGRILDLIRRGSLDLRGVTFAVLDEVDRMLDIGFRDDIMNIMARVSPARQTIFVSATITKEIRVLARGLMRNPVEINVSADAVTVEKIQQDFVSVEAGDKFEALRVFLKRATPRLAIVFTRTKRGASTVSRKLELANVTCAEIHGGLTQGRRTQVLKDLRAGRLSVLVATDLASRGLDVTGVSHVVNYDIPVDPADYVHRIGRSARMGADGHALTLVTPDQGKELTNIERLINLELNEVDTFGVLQSRNRPTAQTRTPAGKVVKAHETRNASARDVKPVEAAASPTRRTLGDRYNRSGRRR
jgi:superfamily II DNA/RNA helicase